MLGSGENGSRQNGSDLGNNQDTQDAGGGAQQHDPQSSGEEQGAVGGPQQDDSQSSGEEQGAVGGPQQDDPQSSDEEQGAVGGQQQDDSQSSDEEQGAVGGQQQDDSQSSGEEQGAVGGPQQDDPQPSDEEQGAVGGPDDPIRATREFLLSILPVTSETANIIAFGGGLWFAFLVAAWAHLRHPISRRAVCHLLRETGYMNRQQVALVESTRRRPSGRESLITDFVWLVLSFILVTYLALGLWLATGTISPLGNQERNNDNDGPPQGRLEDPDVSGDEREREFD